MTASVTLGISKNGRRKKMKLTNLITVKGYQAGRNGNLLISLDDKLVSDQAFRAGQTEIGSIRMLLCVAYVKDDETKAILAKYVDDPNVTPTDRIIVVSKKFMSIGNKKQLILLERHNRLEDDIETSCNMDRTSRANVMTISRYGAFRCRKAFRTEDKIREKSECKIGTAIKKTCRKPRRAKPESNPEKNFNLHEFFGEDPSDEDIEAEPVPEHA